MRGAADTLFLAEDVIIVKHEEKKLMEKTALACKRETRMSRASVVVFAIGMIVVLNVFLANLPAFSIFLWLPIWFGLIIGTLYYAETHRRLSKALSLQGKSHS